MRTVDWPKIRLGNAVIDIQPGFAQRPGLSGANVPQLRTNNVSPQGTIDLSELEYVSVSEGEFQKYRVRKGDVIFNNTNSVEWVGKTAYFDQDRDYVLSNHMTRLRINEILLDAEFLALYLHYQWQIGQSRQLSKQWVNQAAIDQITLSSMQIPLPPLPEQRRIAAILSEADEIRKLRRQANGKMQEIIQSLFYEMFGDPATNPKMWKSVVLGNVVYAVQDGPHVSPTYSEEGIPFLSTRNIRAGQIIWDDLKFISRKEAERHWKKCKPERGDVLYTKGGTTGLAKAVDFDDEVAIWVHIALLKIDRELADPLWLENMLNSNFCYLQSQNFTHGIANRDLGLTRMINIKMYLPPLDLQKQYVAQVTRIREAENQQALAYRHFDTLYQSLLAQAFSGELTASWREAHATELAQEARERDELLRELHATAPTVVTIPLPIQKKVIEERAELAQELTRLQRALLTLVDRNPERYFLVTGLHEEITAHLDEQGGYLLELDEEGLYRDFAGLDCSLDTIRRELHFLAALGLLKEPTLPVEDETGMLQYMTVYRSLLADDDSREQDFELLDEVLMEEASL